MNTLIFGAIILGCGFLAIVAAQEAYKLINGINDFEEEDYE